MNLTLKRNHKDEQGIFGVLTDENNSRVAVCLEHAYVADSYGHYDAKIPPGTYTCKRGPHRLHGMTKDFETFEITGVSGHTNLLFHWGNYNKDSEGCILLGSKFETLQGVEMITHSKDVFKQFMDLQHGLDTFKLTVL